MCNYDIVKKCANLTGAGWEVLTKIPQFFVFNDKYKLSKSKKVSPLVYNYCCIYVFGENSYFKSKAYM